MLIPQLILTPVAIVFIVLGILQQNNDYNKKNIKWANSLRGIKTEITPQTLQAQRLSGMAIIVLGILMILLAFVYIPSLDPALFE